MSKRIIAVILTLGAWLAQVAIAAPAVSINPLTANKYLPGTPISLTATATDASSSIKQVDFYQGTTLIGSAAASPYTITWNGAPVGSYSVTAKATSAANLTTTSTAVNVIVNTDPTVSLTAPASGSSYVGKASIGLSANANDADNNLAKVEFFYNGTQLIGQATASPYAVTWTNVLPGAYTVTARATDKLGGVVTSTGSSVTVTNPITVAISSPATNALFAPPASVPLTASASTSAASDAIKQVDFYNGTTLLGSATASPFTYAWSGVSSGKYSITAKATDNLGLINTSSAVIVLVDTKPTVSLTSPAANSNFGTSAPITLTADAKDSDGTITQVQFYDGATAIKAVQTGPYTYQWSTTVTGSHTVKAIATDNLGVTTESMAVAINVLTNQAPKISVSASPNGALPPATVTLTATATDSDGTVTQVEFFNGSVSLGIVKAAPFTYTWSNLAQNNYTVTAKATDNLGAVTTSQPITVTVGGAQAYYIYADHLNAPRQVVDQSNKVVWQWGQSDPFGGNAPVASNGFELNLRFPGQYYDREANLHYNYYRDYDPQTGRYVQSDPIGLSGGINTYGYVGGNPLSFVDPRGLQIGVPVTPPPLIVPPTSPSPGVDPYDPRMPSPGPRISDLFKPSPYLPTWDWPDWVYGAVGKPPKDAHDPNGAKAPGKPGRTEGFCEPKRGKPEWGRNPNGNGSGWVDADGNVWIPTGPDSGSTGDAHGGPHWDVQKPGGDYENIYPGGKKR